MKNKIIFHIDMNSYFATVAQHFDLNLRGKPVGVMGKGKGTFIIAASKEAKKLGIKTGSRKYEALAKCPDIIFVPPQFDKYVQITSIILEIFHEFSPVVEPFSIDEAFLDMTETYYVKIGLEPVEIAYKIKERMRERLGDVITCSVGIADNKLMAKFASDMQKPDGLVYLTPDKYMEVLDQYPLMDICGIGYRTNEHLKNLGIEDFPTLRKTDFTILKREFGNVTGRFLFNAARGIDFRPVDPSAFFEDPKSISHSETFTEEKEGSELFSNIYKLCEKVSLRLRTKSLFTKHIGVYVKDRNFEGYSFDQKLQFHSNNTLEIFEAAIKQIPKDFVGKFVCIYANDLSRIKNFDLFDESEKQDHLQTAMDLINQKYGHFTILPASIRKPKDLENTVDIPFSGLDKDAKTGTDITTLLRKNLDVIKHKILHKS